MLIRDVQHGIGAQAGNAGGCGGAGCIIVGMNGDEFTARIDALPMPRSAAAARLGISRMTMFRWRRDGVPADRAKLVDLALHCLAIRCDALRPAGEDAGGG